MDENIEKLLGENRFDPPEAFLAKVMQQVDMLPLPQPESPTRKRLQWIALLGATFAGFVQLAAFLFGIWAATTAG